MSSKLVKGKDGLWFVMSREGICISPKFFSKANLKWWLRDNNMEVPVS